MPESFVAKPEYSARGATGKAMKTAKKILGYILDLSFIVLVIMTTVSIALSTSVVAVSDRSEESLAALAIATTNNSSICFLFGAFLSRVIKDWLKEATTEK